ncbi:MAG TPA: glycoside hydrolase family 9 protein [Cytophagales bacterium]|nr:glycoside hydrolase family 9 protein [Cytophagales bacterium]
MKKSITHLAFSAFIFLFSFQKSDENSWIRINQLGYKQAATKVAVFATKKHDHPGIKKWSLVDARSGKSIKTFKTVAAFGNYGPFTKVCRLNFSEITQPGEYFIEAAGIRSPVFRINNAAYNGTADFALQYMRQQRCGYNPYLKDSCHLKDGYTIYGPMHDGTRVDATGGWHDATDYLQYSTTSANATYHLLAAYRDFPSVFEDNHKKNGLDGKSDTPDVLDEAEWGLQWLLKMHPKEEWLFNQIADDRDHAGMRLPAMDSVDYGWGKGNGRPVYFASGEVQGLGKYKNRATGTSSVAGKFSSAFALASLVYKDLDPSLSKTFSEKSVSAYNYGLKKPGVQQTAPNKAPYFYEEDNWVDDMELAAAVLFQKSGDNDFLNQAMDFGRKETVTPWLAADTARHYQWYPFHNFGHYEIAKSADEKIRAEFISYYKQGIEKVWQKANKNGFYRGVPFIWCSNNLTASFAIQCYLYRKLSGDNSYLELEQASIDWLLGVNPWGTSMISGLPEKGDSPVDPHSSLTHLYNYPTTGGLVDGPVSGYIFNSLRGVTLSEPDEYAAFQSMLAVYHDDFSDYSSNEPTMDGTASLVYLLAAIESDKF